MSPGSTFISDIIPEICGLISISSRGSIFAGEHCRAFDIAYFGRNNFINRIFLLGVVEKIDKRAYEYHCDNRPKQNSEKLFSF